MRMYSMYFYTHIPESPTQVWVLKLRTMVQHRTRSRNSYATYPVLELVAYRRVGNGEISPISSDSDVRLEDSRLFSSYAFPIA